MRILLLGGTGFIGTAIQRQRPDWIWTSLGSQDLDLTKNQSHLILDRGFDVVINAAGFYGGMLFNRQYQQEILFRNTEISVNVCRLIQRLRPSKFINIGSACIYPQHCDDLISEHQIGTGNYHNSVIYSALSKKILLDMIPALQLGWEYLIISNVYGPGEHLDPEKSHVVGGLITKIRNATSHLEMIGTGAAVRDFIYVDDMAEAVCLYAERSESSCRPTNISAGFGTSIRDLTEVLVDVSQKSLTLCWGRTEDDGAPYKVLDNTKMVADVKFQPKTLLRDGLEHTWVWANNTN